MAALTVLSCQRATPAGFWAGFHPAEISAQSSDQGPWGGMRWIQWKCARAGTYSEAQARAYAVEHGWECVARREVGATELATWTGSSSARVFAPAEWLRVESGVTFPRHIDGDAILIECKTAWLIEEAGTNELHPAPGYLLISADGREQAVYHVWGNH